MSWGCSGMLKSRNAMDMVCNSWESIVSFFKGYIPLGSRDILIQSLKRDFQLPAIMGV